MSPTEEREEERVASVSRGGVTVSYHPRYRYVAKVTAIVAVAAMVVGLVVKHG